MVVQYGLRWGEVWGTGDASAVAVWLPPVSGDVRLGRMLQLGLARIPLRLGLSGSRRLLRALPATDPCHKTVHGPHWYGDDTTDRAQLHLRIVGELAGAVYSLGVLRLQVPSLIRTGGEDPRYLSGRIRP